MSDRGALRLRAPLRRDAIAYGAMASIEPIAPPIVAAVDDPDRFPHEERSVRLVETHISWVFLTGDRAYKLRKPVVFPFLDYGTVARRRAMCDEELRLGRRLAPDVYLGLRALVERDGELALAPVDDPAAMEHVVEMRRFDDGDTLAARLAGGAVGPDDVRALARLIAAFHAESDAVPGEGSHIAAEAAVVSENFDVLLGYADAIGAERLAAAHRFAAAFLHGRRSLIEGRPAAGCVREGHGDLRAEHVLLRERVEVVDPLEFDPSLRHVDVEADLAFLVMDLVRLGREDLAEALLDEYRARSALPWSDELLWFYATYRAWVRAKVTCLRADELEPGEARDGQFSEAAELARVATRLAWRARRPLLLVVCGGPATGKTTLAAALAVEADLPHLNSDVVRKELAGLAPGETAPPEEYTDAASERTYRELGVRAAASNGGAVVDATFRRRAHREAFAAGLGDAPVRPVFVECVAPAATVAERAQARLADPGRVSDATPEVSARLAGEWEPLDEVDADDHVVLRSDRPVEVLVDAVTAALDRLGRGT